MREQIKLPIKDQPFPARRHAKPILKWVGGKRDMVPLLSESVYRQLQHTHGRYIEPFLGGGAVALDLGLPDMLLADLCGPLINCYEWVRQHPKEVLWSLQQYVRQGTDKAAYLKIRADKNTSRLQSAARFLYLNVTCFNGLYRVNSQGKFNVPHGTRSTGDYHFPSLQDLQQVADALKASDLRCCDFEQLIKGARAGDCLYADPPYYGVYDDYTAEGFSAQDQADLAALLHEAHDRGVTVLATNSDCPEVRELYSWAYVTETREHRRVNRDATKRAPIGCLLIASSSASLITP